MISLSTIFFKRPGSNFKMLGKIKCPHCNHYYSMPEFHRAVFLYGVYFLVSPTDGYLGTKCINPKCTRTLSFKGTREEVNYFKNELFPLLDLGSFQRQPNFRYHSPLKWSPDQYSCLKLFDIMHATLATGEIDIETIDMRVRDHEKKESYLSSEYYNSYVEGCGEPIGNILPVWWFKKEEVENLIKIEDEKQISIFPRYIMFDPLYLEARSFCWNYHFEQKFYGSLNFPRAAEIRTGNIAKNLIDQNYDFALMLDIAPYATTGSTQMVVNIAGHSFSWLKKDIDRLNNESELMQPRLIEHEKMIDELWNNYHTQYMQEQLTRLSTDFIFEYLEAIARTDFSYTTLWDLKSNYLKNIYDAYKSRRKKALNKKIAREKNKKWIDKECPAFQKIISIDDNINQLKLKLTSLAGSPKKNKIFLLLGESGTGKTLFARGIHDASLSESNHNLSEEERPPFVKLNCANIQEKLLESELFGYEKGSHGTADKDKQGKFVAADGGTLFLDEIGNLSIANQEKLLTVFDGKERTFYPIGANKPKTVELTTVFATNKDLAEEEKKGNFIFELYVRINGLNSEIPPLRARVKEDLGSIIKQLIKQEAEENQKSSLGTIGITDDAFNILAKHSWPGNVRELESLIARIIMLRHEHDTSDISEDEIPQEISAKPEVSGKKLEKSPKYKPGPRKSKSLIKEDTIVLLKECNGNKSEAARRLGMSREHFTKETIKMGITKETIKMWL